MEKLGRNKEDSSIIIQKTVCNFVRSYAPSSN